MFCPYILKSFILPERKREKKSIEIFEIAFIHVLIKLYLYRNCIKWI